MQKSEPAHQSVIMASSWGASENIATDMVNFGRQPTTVRQHHGGFIEIGLELKSGDLAPSLVSYMPGWPSDSTTHL